MSDFISPRSRGEFRTLMTDSTVGKIDHAFRDEGFTPVADLDYEDSSERRRTTQSFLAAIDWTDRKQCPRVVRVFERLLISLAPAKGLCPKPDTWSMFTIFMKEDGWEVHESGRVSSLSLGEQFTHLNTSVLNGPSAIHEQLERLRRSQDDPAAVIGGAKELIESTAKTVLNQLGIDFSSNEKIPHLVKKVQLALGLDPTGVSGIDGEASTKRILGGASNVALGLNELRNAGHGTGHGPETARVGLHHRHARLAVNAATLWCELVLETLADPDAPWHSNPQALAP